jgi:hypothetical protein
MPRPRVVRRHHSTCATLPPEPPAERSRRRTPRPLAGRYCARRAGDRESSRARTSPARLAVRRACRSRLVVRRLPSGMRLSRLAPETARLCCRRRARLGCSMISTRVEMVHSSEHEGRFRQRGTQHLQPTETRNGFPHATAVLFHRHRQHRIRALRMPLDSAPPSSVAADIVQIPSNEW